MLAMTALDAKTGDIVGGGILHHLDAERAGFTREGVVRSMPKPDGRRVDKKLFSLLPGE
jgi:hypothetical protein